ncbi:MAG: AAA family ATPase, partial [Lachnospiraceae bacterium]|nr:AAA family ATPase [Lachnospiraceae bacterium]
PTNRNFENPGYIRTGKTQMMMGGVSDPRNKTLLKMFNLINVGERSGSGVPNIINTWKDEGWVEPMIEEQFDPDRTILTLEFKKQTVKKSGDKRAAINPSELKVSKKMRIQQETILGYMNSGEEYKLEDFCTLLELKQSRVKTIIQALVKTGKIEALGNNRNRRYIKRVEEE